MRSTRVSRPGSDRPPGLHRLRRGPGPAGPEGPCCGNAVLLCCLPRRSSRRPHPPDVFNIPAADPSRNRTPDRRGRGDGRPIVPLFRHLIVNHDPRNIRRMEDRAPPHTPLGSRFVRGTRTGSPDDYMKSLSMGELKKVSPLPSAPECFLSRNLDDCYRLRHKLQRRDQSKIPRRALLCWRIRIPMAERELRQLEPKPRG